MNKPAFHLNDPKLLCDQAYINGECVPSRSAKTFGIFDPATQDLIATVPDLDVEETRHAIEIAEKAQQEWAKRPAKERAKIMRAWFNLIIENTEDLAKLITLENGKPINESRTEVAYGASFVEWFAEEGRRVYGDIIPAHDADKRIVVIKQPVGVVGAITPWNFPIAMITRKVSPAIAVGCAVIVKPAEQTPLSALAVAQLAHRAGIPAGVLNIVTSNDGAAIGKELCENPLVRKITFTGSTQVGRILMRQCAPSIKKLSLELGGNAPFIVFNDADIDAAVEGAIVSKFRNAGQTCVCANRIYVQREVYDEFTAKLADAVAGLSVGSGMEPGAQVGPLIDQQGMEKVVSHIEDAISKGATILIGGAPHERGGTFYRPTVVSNATPDMKFAREETFGPVAPIFRFEDEADVVAQANDTEFGLAAYFYARDISRVWTVAEALEYGMVGVNTGIISNEIAPFGGVKQSGLGREGSKYGTDDFVAMKYICMGGI